MIKKDLNNLMAIIVESVFNKNYTNFISATNSIEDENFVVDFLVEEKISSNDFAKIEKLINKVITGALEIKSIKISSNDAKKEFKNNKYMMQFIENNSENLYLVELNGYKTLSNLHFDFKKTNVIKAFKLFSIGGCY